MKNIVFLALLVSFGSFAQRNGDKIQAAKIGVITNRLNLTAEQSPQFWSLYNDYTAKRKEFRQNVKLSLEDASAFTATDDKILLAIKEAQNAREKEIALEREFMPKFLKVISVRQYAELLRTERNFNQMLLKKLNEEKN